LRVLSLMVYVPSHPRLSNTSLMIRIYIASQHAYERNGNVNRAPPSTHNLGIRDHRVVYTSDVEAIGDLSVLRRPMSPCIPVRHIVVPRLTRIGTAQE
jgi:hypothetical protein